ncbi:MAG: ATP-binding protein, partial [bacterium]
LFQSGFSTAKVVTDVSGRGVGLDVVRSKIEALSGQVHIESKLGEYTKFQIELPLTLSIIQSMLVKISEEKYSPATIPRYLGIARGYRSQQRSWFPPGH